MPLRAKKDKKIGKILVEANVITEKQLQDALYRQKETGGRLGSNLVELGYLDEDDLTPYIAEQHGMPFICLDKYDINSRVYNIIPDEIIHAYGMIPIDLIRDIITLAITDVPSGETIKGIEKLTGFKIQVVMITKSDFNRYTKNAYDLSVVDKDKESESANTEQFIKTPEYQGRERRRYARFSQRLKVKYEFKDEVTVNPSVNISRGGVLIKSKSPVPVNAHIILRIELPNAHEDVIVISRVVWVEKISDTDTYMIALSFSSMGSDDNKTLVRFIETIGNSRTF